ncbi:helix-turn-helix domain-containing protein [Saccharospirillum impatiens]|uniref:helix-turn-helix domain-containing protein n=1 Tax=Saccharospirillum impatiens TaxID=169438 RepID=UPI0009FE1F26|nr:helix-turn-helix domain-containing protein [Saccharospirillum impatiens]
MSTIATKAEGSEAVGKSASLQHREYPACRTLDPFVTRYLHSYGPTAATVVVPPTGAHYITHVIGEPMQMRFANTFWPRCPSVFVGGQLRKEMPVATVAEGTQLLGVEFRPTGFYRLFHNDCRQFTDGITDIREIAPEWAAGLYSALFDAKSISAKINVLEHYLSCRIDAALATTEVDRAVALIERSNGCVRVDELAEQCNCNAKKLYRHFQKTIGVSPKYFSKIVQINSVVAHIKSGHCEGLQQIALAQGYYDQAHFTRDFQRFIGTNPLDFLRHPTPFLSTYLGRMANCDALSEP